MSHPSTSSSEEILPNNAVDSLPKRQLRMKGRGRRQDRWNVRASPSDAEVILGKADKAGVSVPRLLVSLAVGAKVRSSVERKATVATLLSLRPLLAGEANNLNQLAHWANTHHDLPEGFAELVVRVDRTLLLVEAAVEEVRKS